MDWVRVAIYFALETIRAVIWVLAGALVALACVYACAWVFHRHDVWDALVTVLAPSNLMHYGWKIAKVLGTLLLGFMFIVSAIVVLTVSLLHWVINPPSDN